MQFQSCKEEVIAWREAKLMKIFVKMVSCLFVSSVLVAAPV